MTFRLLLLTATLLLAQTGSRDIPIYPGDPDSGLHADQPKWCQAKDGGGYRANCGICNRTCFAGDSQENPKCKVYCRPKACKCHAECTTSHRKLEKGKVAE